MKRPLPTPTYVFTELRTVHGKARLFDALLKLSETVGSHDLFMRSYPKLTKEIKDGAEVYVLRLRVEPLDIEPKN